MIELIGLLDLPPSAAIPAFVLREVTLMNAYRNSRRPGLLVQENNLFVICAELTENGNLIWSCWQGWVSLAVDLSMIGKVGSQLSHCNLKCQTCYLSWTSAIFLNPFYGFLMNFLRYCRQTRTDHRLQLVAWLGNDRLSLWYLAWDWLLSIAVLPSQVKNLHWPELLMNLSYLGWSPAKDP